MKKYFLTGLCMLLVLGSVLAQDTENEQGNMTFIISDNVSPSNFAEYEQWIKEFKALADETGAPDYSVSQNEQGMSFFMNIGKTMAGYDELNKKFGEWFTNNPKAMEMDKKYEHTRNYSRTSLWRHNPPQSYIPEGYDNSISRTYTRVFWNWIKSGQTEKANEIIGEYVAEWTRAGISASTDTHWNIFGQEQACVVFVTTYENPEAWMASRAEIREKVGEAKLNELENKFNAVLRKQEQSESFGRPDLSHTNQ